MARLRSASSELALQDVALDDDQDVVLGRGEALGDFLVLLELGRIGTEELAQRIVDLDPHQAEYRGDGNEDGEDGDRHRTTQRKQADLLDAESDVDAARPIRA